MIRLCAAAGTWQLITLRAALEQARRDGRREPACRDVLVLYDVYGSREVVEWMWQVAPHLWDWAEIIDASEVLACPGLKGDVWPLPVDEWRAEVKRRCGADVAELWMCHVEGPGHRLLLETYPGARVTLFEDGRLGRPRLAHWTGRDYAAFLRLAPRLLLRGRVRRHLDSLRMADWRVPARYFPRIEAKWLFLRDLPVPPPYCDSPTRPVSREALVESMRLAVATPLVREQLAAIPAAAPEDVVMLGTFHGNQVVRAEDDLRIYGGVARALVGKGYRVWWKGHPRDASRVFEQIAPSLPGGRFMRLSCSNLVPLQLVMEAARFPVCCAAESTVMHYLPGLFGTAVFFFIHHWSPVIRTPWQEEWVRYWQQYARPVEDVPSLAAGAPS